MTGLEGVKILSSIEDKLDRLLVSFKDAKVRSKKRAEGVVDSFENTPQIALLEWSNSIHDLVTVSIHTYERAPQLVSQLSFSLHQDTDGISGISGFVVVSSEFTGGTAISLRGAVIANGCHSCSPFLSDASRTRDGGARSNSSKVCVYHGTKKAS